MVGADASHAWVSAYCPGIGWLDVDPTNDVVPSTGHVTIAWGRDFGDVSPLHGLILAVELTRSTSESTWSRSIPRTDLDLLCSEGRSGKGKASAVPPKVPTGSGFGR